MASFFQHQTEPRARARGQNYPRLLPHIPMHRTPLPSRPMRLIRQRMHSRRINPSIVKIEQRANRDREIDCLVRPAHRVQRLHILGRNPRRIMVDFVNKAEQRLLFLRERRAFQILQHAPHQLLAAQQFSRNCGVRLQSKRTVVPVRCVRGDQLPNPRRNWPFLAHDLLREPRQMLRGSRPECKHVPDLRILASRFLHHPDHVAIGAGLRILLHPRKKHRLHRHRIL